MSDSKNTRNKAAAITYHDNEPAPRITASGTGRTADYIINVAKKSNVTIIKDIVLADVLSQYPAGDFIPERTYAAVAAVLVFTNKLGSM